MDMTGIYAKDINRTIDGVIKADESAHIRSEVDEYVMTSEIRAGLDRILDEWNAPRPQSNGVWISGFFGSGKSHMLKMMSYLLGDVRGSGEMTRQQVAEVFTQKARGHEMLIAGIGRSQQIPALSMLFNIDAKDDKATSRAEAMIEVFYRAFFEARGLYTADLGVGALERDLVDRGLFDQFKECFRAVAGGEWEDRRAGTVFAEAPTATNRDHHLQTTMKTPHRPRHDPRRSTPRRRPVTSHHRQTRQRRQRHHRRPRPHLPSTRLQLGTNRPSYIAQRSMR